MPGRTAIFIDGAYLDFVVRETDHGASIDYALLSAHLSEGSELLRTYYYHCPAYQGRRPTEDERSRYASQRKFFAALEDIPRFTVRLGRLAYRGNDPSSGHPRYEQKMVDILLGVDMVQLAAKKVIQEAILVAGDGDFLPAVTAAKQDGVLVRLFHGAKPDSALRAECDERTLITPAMIDAVRRHSP